MRPIFPLHSTCPDQMAIHVYYAVFQPRCSTVWCKYFVQMFPSEHLTPLSLSPFGWVSFHHFAVPFYPVAVAVDIIRARFIGRYTGVAIPPSGIISQCHFNRLHVQQIDPTDVPRLPFSLSYCCSVLSGDYCRWHHSRAFHWPAHWCGDSAFRNHFAMQFQSTNCWYLFNQTIHYLLNFLNLAWRKRKRKL